MKPVPRHVIGHRGESTTIILLNGHSIELIPNDSNYTHRMSRSTVTREASICNIW